MCLLFCARVSIGIGRYRLLVSGGSLPLWKVYMRSLQRVGRCNASEERSRGPRGSKAQGASEQAKGRRRRRAPDARQTKEIVF